MREPRSAEEILPRATVTRKGQITVPVVVRRRLGLRPGDEIAFRPDGRLMPLPRARLSELAGVMPPRSRRSRTIGELRQEISDDLSAGRRSAAAPSGKAREEGSE